MLNKLQGRNGTGEFARRSMKNLDYIVKSAESNPNIHPVTQTITALLAILIFPWERSAFNEIKKRKLPELTCEDWPVWEMSGSRVDQNKVKTLGHLVKLLRDSIAHGNVSFSSDSQKPNDVTVMFENIPNGADRPDWKGTIAATKLIAFCRRFSIFIADHVS